MKNVLFISIDQLRGDCLSAAGHPMVKTPNLDRLASEGTLFARHYAGAVPCSPARACLYTGLYQMNNRVCINGTPLDARHDTIALAAQRFGYQPTLFGYTDQALDPRMAEPGDPRLNTYEGLLPGMSSQMFLGGDETPWLNWLAARGHDIPDNPLDIHLPKNGPADPPTTTPPVYSAEETQTAYLTDGLMDWIDVQPDGWFAHLSFIRPHPPFIVPAPYNTIYDPDQVPAFVGRESAADEQKLHPFLVEAFRRSTKNYFVHGAHGRIDDWSQADLRQIRATYYGMVSEVDAQLGRLFDHLRRQDNWDNTLIIVTGDHGEMLGDHFLFGKPGFFEQTYHIPLIIRDPDRSDHTGQQIDHFTEAVDVMPTVLQCLGAPVPRHLDGRSLAPFLEGVTPPKWREAAHYEGDFRRISGGEAHIEGLFSVDQMNLAVSRGERFKYVHFAALPPLLFDLQNDPGETVNLADDPEYLAVRVNCAEELLRWRATHLDRTLSRTELTEDGPIKADTLI